MRRTALQLTLFCILASDGFGATVGVPGDHALIQDAIDAASDGDTVEVSPGTYTGPGNRDLDFDGKNLVLRSALGPAQTELDSQGSRALSLSNGEGLASVLEGFRLTGGALSGGGVMLDSARLTVKNCIFDGNHALTGRGGAIRIVDGRVELFDCTFQNNSALEGGAVSLAGASSASATSTLFSGNASTQGKGGAIEMDSQQGTGLSLLYSTIASNQAATVGGGIGADGSVAGIDLTASIVYGNGCAYAQGREISNHTVSTVNAFHLVTDTAGVDVNLLAGMAILSEDPLFCAPLPAGNAPSSGGDYYLDSNSVAVSHPSCGTFGWGWWAPGCAITTDVEDTEDSRIVARIRPTIFTHANRSFHLTGLTNAEHIDLYDVRGRKISGIHFDRIRQEGTLPVLPPGVYFLRQDAQQSHRITVLR